jgi:hypothetical protein
MIRTVLHHAAPRVVRLIALLVVLTAAACGGDAPEPAEEPAPTDQPPAIPQDACALLPAERVQEVLGEAVTPTLAMRVPVGDGPAMLSQCNYQTATNPAAASITLRRSTEGETVAGALDAIRRTLEEAGTDPEDIEGVGAAALWGGNQLHVFSSRGWSLVVIPTPTGGLSQARFLAEHALDAL